MLQHVPTTPSTVIHFRKATMGRTSDCETSNAAVFNLQKGGGTFKSTSGWRRWARDGHKVKPDLEVERHSDSQELWDVGFLIPLEPINSSRCARIASYSPLFDEARIIDEGTRGTSAAVIPVQRR